MLEQFSDQIRICYERAAEAKERADATNDPALKREFLNTESRWLTLARSYGFTESLEDFTTENLKRRQNFNERIRAGAELSINKKKIAPTPLPMLPEQALVNILIVDDDPRNLTLLEAILDNPGYRLVRAESAEQALGALLADKFALLIIDIRMPGMSGLELAQVIKARKNTTNVPIIFLTAYSDDDQQIIEGYQTGAVDYVAKPLNPAILRWKVGIFAQLYRRQRNLEKVNRFLAAVVESSDDAIVSKDLNGTIATFNQGAERLFGYTAEEVVGKPVTILIPPDRQHEEVEILARIRRGESVEHYETMRRRKDGTLVDISLTVSPVRDDRGEIIGASKIARDITERKRNDENIAVLAREAEHRTKNILASVQATINLSHSDTADSLKRAIEGRVLALANVHSLFVKSRWSGAELSSIVTQELAPYLGEDKARAQIDGPHVLLATNQAQAMAVTVHELATNAAKYGALSVPKGSLRVTWSHASDGQLTLHWTESGGPPIKKPARRGFGMSVIKQMIRQEGEIRLDWRAEGLACEIVFQPSTCRRSRSMTTGAGV
jgi:PAS domain S-box-containing protein